MKEMGIEEVPQGASNVFKNMSYRDIAKPLVLTWRERGLTFGQIQTKCDLSWRQVKHILHG